MIERDDVVALVRARLLAEGSLPASFDAETAEAVEVAVEWERHVIALADQVEIDESVRAFRQRWPALFRWRTGVLAAPKRVPPSTVAAAWECVALECLLAGEMELADEAQSAAVRVMMERRR
jgi:hypothetical protein